MDEKQLPSKEGLAFAADLFGLRIYELGLYNIASLYDKHTHLQKTVFRITEEKNGKV